MIGQTNIVMDLVKKKKKRKKKKKEKKNFSFFFFKSKTRHPIRTIGSVPLVLRHQSQKERQAVQRLRRPRG